MIKGEKDIIVNNDKNLSQLMDALKAFSEELTSEVSLSSSMLSNGIKTELAQKLQEISDNPYELLLQTKDNIDNAAYYVSDSFFNTFFKKSAKFIKRVFLDRSGNYSNYYIVLKDDNQKNRENLYRFLTGYRYSNFGRNYPVSFQVLPDSDDLASIKKSEVKFAN